MAVWRALQRFDPSRASLRTFVEMVVAARFASLMRARRSLPVLEPIEEYHLIGLDGIPALEFRVDFRRAAASLTEPDRRLARFLTDHTPTEAGRALGIARSTVYEAIHRIRAAFEKAGFGRRDRSRMMTDGPLFPAELTARNQWCLWRIEPDRKGRPTKIPYRPDGRKAASDNPATWSAFQKVCDVLREQPGSYNGVGFFFSADDPICGVDLDTSLDGDGNPLGWATDIISRFQNTYCARSVSGHGLHILCHASLPGKGRNFYVPDGPIDANGKRAQIGIFDRARFFALTGERHRDSPLELADHQETVEWLLDLMQRRRHCVDRPATGMMTYPIQRSSSVPVEQRTVQSSIGSGRGIGRATTGRSPRQTSRCAASSRSGAAPTRRESRHCSRNVVSHATSGPNERITASARFRPPSIKRPNSTVLADENRSLPANELDRAVQIWTNCRKSGWVPGSFRR